MFRKIKTDFFFFLLLKNPANVLVPLPPRLFKAESIPNSLVSGCCGIYSVVLKYFRSSASERFNVVIYSLNYYFV